MSDKDGTQHTSGVTGGGTPMAESVENKEHGDFGSEPLVDLNDFRKKGNRNVLFIALCGIFLVLAAAVAMFLYFLFMRWSIFYVSGSSMEPTLKEGDAIILKYQKEVENDNITVVRKPNLWGDSTAKNDSSKSPMYRELLIKRIVALPGQELTIDKEGVHVDGELVRSFAENNYRCERLEETPRYTHTLTNNQIFVMGDNMNHSFDSLAAYCDLDAAERVPEPYKEDGWADGEMPFIYVYSKDMVQTGSVAHKFDTNIF